MPDFKLERYFTKADICDKAKETQNRSSCPVFFPFATFKSILLMSSCYFLVLSKSSTRRATVEMEGSPKLSLYTDSPTFVMSQVVRSTSVKLIFAKFVQQSWVCPAVMHDGLVDQRLQRTVLVRPISTPTQSTKSLDINASQF